MNPKVEWLLKRPRYQRGLMLAGVMAVVIGLFVYLMYLPLQDELTRLNEEDETLQRKLVNDRRIASNLPKFKAEYEKMVTQLDQALTELPNDKEIPKLLTSIAAAAKENGLEVQSFKPGSESKKAFYAEVPVSLNLTGTFHQVAMFFYDVGNLPRIVNLSNVKLGGSNKGAGKVRLSVNCLATTFRFLNPSEMSDKKKK
ncbi:MAG: pilus assembly protein PilO [Desulfuromonas sp.]|nr:MAG: pilus assembly protein PilO [Desulfuromonas sp.]